MSCNASDGPSLLAPLTAQKFDQQFSNIQDVAALSSSVPLASSSSLPTAEPSQHFAHTYGTRTRQNSVLKPTVRALYSHNAPIPVSTLAVPLPAQTPSGSTLSVQVKKEQPKPRRIRPLTACASPNSSDDAGKHTTGVLKGILKGVKDAGRKPVQQPLAAPPGPTIEFPPSHVVLHPDDASNKVFLAIGKAFMSVDNRAMTVKDLADLALKQGLACQNASAAAQAITFFIRSHLQRCEDEQDFPLLLRHVLSGTPRDDALVPALYSRLGGNVISHKGGSSAAANSSNASANANPVTSPTEGQENLEKSQERLTSFRRGTTVWYLSRAAGAPCPFASSGIALRDYSECSGITGAESRRGAGSSTTPGSGSGSGGSMNWTDDEGEGGTEGVCRGLKRKRAGLRTRNASGAVVGGRTKNEPIVIDDDVKEGRKPPKVKLTLKLRPPQSCLSVVTKPVVRETQSDSSDSSSEESDSDDDSDGSMDVDVVGESTPVKTTSQPLQPQHQEHLQPFTFPPFPLQRRISIPPYTPAEEDFPVHSSHRAWTAAAPTFNANGFSIGVRETSVPLSVASPPPDSDDEDFNMDDEEFDENSPVLNFVKKEEEIPFKFDWPLAAIASSSSSSSSSSPADLDVKTEDFDFNFFSAEPEDLGFGSLNLGLDNVKVEEDTDDLTATYMRALADVMPAYDGDGEYEDAFDVESVVHRSSVAPPSMSGWQDADYHEAMPTLEPDFERDWADAEVSEENHTAWESHVRGHDDDERSSSPALTYAASSPADSSMSSSEMHDDDDDEEEEEERESVGPASPPLPSAPALFFGPELREESLGASLISRKNTPSPSPSALLLSRTSSATGKPRMPLPMPSSAISIPIQQRPPTIADTTDSDSIDASSAPWERGMLTVADVEAHLLPALSPTYEYPTAMPPFSSQFSFSVSGEGSLMEPPLSPQEEEVFQNFCLFDGPPVGADSASGAEEDQDETRDDPSPKTVKRHSKVQPKEKEADVVEESSKPLRRSRRVANAVASQQTAAAKARLRRRN